MKNICEWNKCKKIGLYKAPVEKDNSKKFKFYVLSILKNLIRVGITLLI